MVDYDMLLESCKFLCRKDLFNLGLCCRWTHDLVEQNQFYWPLNSCYRLTFLEYYAITTLARVPDLSNHPIQNRPQLLEKLHSIQLPIDAQIPLFLEEVEPTFLVFEFSTGRKFFIKLEPFLNAENLEKIAFWFDQISDVYFTEEIRGLLDIRKFNPALLDDTHGLARFLHFNCKTLGCYEYEAFNQLSVQFMMKHMKIRLLDKANGTIYSPYLLQFLHNGSNCCKAFSTRWVMGCGDEFTDNLIQHALNTESPENMVPNIRITPSSHHQRELPIPLKSLVPSSNICLIKREFGDWKYEEWLLQNMRKSYVHFRVSVYIYNDVETGEEALSQFNIERINMFVRF